MKNDIIKTVEGYELSVNQMNLWSVGKEHLDAYFNQIIVEIKSEVSYEELKKAIESVVIKNRTLLFKAGELKGSAFPIQTLSESSEIDFQHIILSKDEDQNLFLLPDQLIEKDYDPFNDNPFIAYWVEQEEYKFLIVRIYSLWADSFSTVFFIEELKKVLSDEEEYKKEEREIVEYEDFAVWQNQLFNEPEEEGVNFWRGYKFNCQKEVIPFASQSEKLFQPKRKILTVYKGKEYEKLAQTALEAESSVEQSFFSAFAFYLTQFTEEEITVGYLPFKRSYTELDNTFGLVSKAIPINFSQIHASSKSELTSHLQKSIDEISMWADYFYQDRISSDEPQQHVFKYAFEFIGHFGEQACETPDIRVRDLYSVVDAFDLKLQVVDYGDKLIVSLYYNQHKFSDNVAKLVGSQLEKNLQQGSMGLSKEGNKIITASNNSAKEFDEAASVIDLFIEQAERNPDAIALLLDNVEITYAALNRQSDQFAHYLINHCGIKHGQPVSLLLERSEWFVMCMLGILKAGGYYVPIDSSYPAERIAYILNDCDSKVLVSNILSNYQLELKEVEVVDPTLQDIYQNNYELLPPGNLSSEDIAYCIYTSGSTGNPKGCLITQGNLLNYVQWANDFYFKDENLGNWGLITSLSFDLTVTALYTSLTRGKKLWIGSDKKEIDVLLRECFANPHIDTLKLTPSHLSLLKELNVDETNISLIICGGEQLTQNQLNAAWAINEHIRIFNEYGPTEATVGCVVKEMFPQQRKVLIGKPIANTQINIITKEDKEVDVGVVGELIIRGKGVALGYLNRPDLNAEKFINDALVDELCAYKTGDLGRWLPSGDIELLGRKDEQIKISGYRIEPDEIKQKILAIKDIAEAEILVNEQGDTKELIAYFVSAKKQDTQQLKSYLENKLPFYMVPIYFVQIDAFPLTINGKVDKRYLLDIKLDDLASRAEYIAPSSQVEKKLAAIWEKILKRTNIGLNDDFFHLGGHSLKATQLVNHYHQAFNIKMGLKDIFEHTTLKSHSKLIADATDQEQQHVSIAKAEEMEDYPVSDGQKRLWVLSQMPGGAQAYNMPFHIQLKGEYDVAKFMKAVSAVIDRHEILRTIFKTNENGELRQRVVSMEDLLFTVGCEDYRTLPDKEQKAEEYIQSDAYKPFDLEQGPLIRASILQLANTHCVFYFNMHHIISDGWSIEVLYKDVMAHYEALKENKINTLPSLPIQYKDYAVWQKAKFNNPDYVKHKEFWMDILGGELPVLDLPFVKMRPMVKTYTGRSLKTYIAAGVCDKLKAYNKQHGGSLFMSLLATCKIFLYKYTGEKDIILGTPVSGRNHSDLENQIGFYVNTLALRNHVDKDESFDAFYQKVKNTTLASFEHQAYPFDHLVEELNVTYDVNRNPVFDVMVALQNAGNDYNNLTLGEDVVESIQDKGAKVSKFDIAISFQEEGKHVSMQVTYNTNLYDQGVIERLVKHYKNLLKEVLEYPAVKIKDVNYLSAEEKEALLYTFNSTQRSYPHFMTLIELFKEQVNKNGKATALICGETNITYQQLNELSNQFGHYLKKAYHISAKDTVALELPRSEWYIVGILGILKLGAAYVPLDETLPDERKMFILENAKCCVNVDSAVMESFIHNMHQYSTSRVEEPANSDSLAYIMYTSGSTGKPKGVMIKQKSIVRLVKNTNYIQVDEGDRILGLSAFSFDGATFDIFMPLLNGATLVIAAKDIFLNLNHLNQIIKDNKISSFFLTTVFFNALVDAGPDALEGLKYILFGGERVSVDHVKRFKALYSKVNLVHMYGPTENTTFSTFYQIGSVSVDQKTIPIGSPVSNTTCYILDSDRNPVPVGVAGEIYLGGDGLASGYLNDQQLNDKKFINHPFSKGDTLYKTGDIGKWLDSGDVEFIGRRDNQVKIRGHRIELGEIENALLKLPQIDEAVVLAPINSQGEKELVAYISASDGLESGEIKKLLSGMIASYMIPTWFVQLENLPTNTNGKVDKKKLLEVKSFKLAESSNYIAPQNNTETQLVTIWKNVLQKDIIGVKDDFFALGGHSLKAMAVLNEIHKTFKINIKVKDIYNCPTIEKLAEEVSLALSLTSLQKEKKETKSIKI